MPKVVTKTGLSPAWVLAHWTLILFTGGLWFPVYAFHRREANRRAVTYLPPVLTPGQHRQ